MKRLSKDEAYRELAIKLLEGAKNISIPIQDGQTLNAILDKGSKKSERILTIVNETPFGHSKFMSEPILKSNFKLFSTCMYVIHETMATGLCYKADK